MENFSQTQSDLFETLVNPDENHAMSDADIDHEIRALKTKLGTFFRTKHTLAKGVSEIIYCNDGTGTGKSYGQLNAFIEEAPDLNSNEKHRVLLFMTPQKSQIKFDEGLIGKADGKEIEFVPLLSIKDRTELDFKCWVKKPYEESHETNADKFNRWEHDPQLKRMPEEHELFVRRLKRLRYCKDTLQEVRNYEHRDEDLIKNREDEKKNAEKSLLKAIEDLALKIGNKREGGFKSLFKSTKENENQLREVVKHAFPLEVAKYKCTVLMATTAKFDTNATDIRLNSEGEFKGETLPFPCVIGGKLKSYAFEADIDPSMSNDERLEAIKAVITQDDPDNYFRTNGITFVVAIDEEHDSYGRLYQSSHSELFNQEDGPASDVLASICRIIELKNELEGEPRETWSASEIEIHDFAAGIEEVLKEKCRLTEDVSLLDVARLFSNNISKTLIDPADFEQIASINRNVFSFTAKHFFNEDALRRIGINEKRGGVYLKMIPEGSTGIPTLYDFYSVLKAALYAAAVKMSDRSASLAYFTHGGDKSQNFVIENFIKKARKYSAEIQSLFGQSQSDEVEVDAFMVFFLPKVVFSIEPTEIPSNHFKPDTNEPIIISFRMELVREMPEIDLIRMTHGTANSVLCLSATTGTHERYNGQYNRGFLEMFSSNSDNFESPFSYKIRTRSGEDLKNIAELNGLRKKLRDIDFTFFAENETRIPRGDGNDAHNARLKQLLSSLENLEFHHRPNKRTNPFQARDFDRCADALISAASDRRHTLILSQSGKFLNSLRDYFKGELSKRSRSIQKVSNDEACSCWDFKPFKKEDTKLRVVFFNSDIASENPDLHENIKSEDENTFVVLVSHFKGAGTGLNFHVLEKDTDGTLIKRDFERLVITANPFFTNIFNGTSLHTTPNCIVALKNDALSDEDVFLSDVDSDYLNKRSRIDLLWHEHHMEKLFMLEQFIGRKERNDRRTVSQIFMPVEALKESAVRYAILSRDEKNDLAFASKSVLNTEFKSRCSEYTSQHSFAHPEERDSFESQTEEKGEYVDELCASDDGFIVKILQTARSEDGSQRNAAVCFNNKFRELTCLTDPERYQSELNEAAHCVAKAVPGMRRDHLQRAIKSLFIAKTGEAENITFCRTKENPGALTDIINGHNIYDPASELFPRLNTLGDRRANDPIEDVVKAVSDQIRKAEEAFKTMVPHPLFMPAIKGNLGEVILDKILDAFEVQKLEDKEVFDIEPRMYELFDRYCKIDNSLVCIDAKNWSKALMSEKRAAKFTSSVKSKIEDVEKWAQDDFDDVIFIYLNTRPDFNERNRLSEVHPSRRSWFLNAFVKEPYYKPDNQARKNTKVEHVMRINSKLASLLGQH